ncbi:unnamed protein product [Caenorhabditis brenneri]
MSFHQKATKSLEHGCPNEVKRLKEVIKKYEEIRSEVPKIEEQLNRIDLDIARLLNQDQQIGKNRKMVEKLEQKKKELKKNLRTQKDEVDKIQKNQQSKIINYSNARKDILIDLRKMAGYQLIAVYWYIKHVMETTSDIVKYECYLENMLLPIRMKALELDQITGNSSGMVQEQPEEVFEDARESLYPPTDIKIDEDFLNASLIVNTSSGIGAEVLEKFKEGIKSMESPVFPVATLPCPTFGPKIQSLAIDIFDKFAADKKEHMQMAILSEKLEQVNRENWAQAIIKRNEQMLMVQKNQDEERKAKLEQDRKNKEEFEKKLKDQQTENDRKLNEKRQKREEYEEETRRLEEEDFKKFEVYSETIVKCHLAQFRFEAKEKEWSDWLKMLQNSIAKAKSQFSEFENMITFRQEHIDSKLMEELDRVHITTLGAYHIMYKAWHVAKHYSDSYEDKIFLKILLVNFCTICDKLCSILESIDCFELSSPDPVKQIRIKFSQINAFDIYNTAKLRIMSKTARLESYQNLPEPNFYDEQIHV